MSVDISTWDEDPAKNGKIEGMSLAKSAPMSNVAGMVATLMAAIKSGDVKVSSLTIADIAGLVAALAAKADTVDAVKSITRSGTTFTATRADGTTFTFTQRDNDTKNTAGSTDSSSKLFLIGATSQAANPQTYSHDTAYIGTDGCLYSGGVKVLTSHQDISGKADATHSHVGSEVTLTGYAKASSASAVAATDTVNEAFGKVQKSIEAKAADSAVVHNTGTETIAGPKTFTSDINIHEANPSVICDVTGTTKGTAPSADKIVQMGWYDGSGTDGNAQRYGGAVLTLYANGDVRAGCMAFKNAAGATANAGVYAVYPASGDPYGTAPETPASGNDADIVTRGFLAGYTKKKTFATTPVFTATLAEDTEATTSAPYTITAQQLGGSYQELYIHMTVPAGTAGAMRIYANWSNNAKDIGQVNNAVYTSALCWHPHRQ